MPRLRGFDRDFSRFLIEHADLSTDENFMRFLEMLRETIGLSIKGLMTCKPDHVMMGMSAETFGGGIKGNDGFVDRIQEMVGHDTGLTTGANAVIAALEALGVEENEIVVLKCHGEAPEYEVFGKSMGGSPISEGKKPGGRTAAARTTLSLLWGRDRQTTEGTGDFFGDPPIDRL